MPPTLFVSVLFLLQTVLFLGHGVIYFYLKDIFRIYSSSGEFILALVLFFLSIFFTIFQIVTYKFNNIFSRFFYKIAAVWIGLFVYLLMASVFWSIFGQKTGLIFFWAATFMTIYGLINANIIRSTKIKISLPNLPSFWVGKTIIFFSDTHLGQIRGEKFLRKIVNKINKYKPELILHGGDFYDGVEVDRKRLAEILGKESVSQSGVYFVTGNHESFADPKVYTDALKDAGIHVLANELVDIKGLQLIGIDYGTTEKELEYREVLERLKIDPQMPSILIKHTPLLLKEPEAKKVNLSLSGHSHRGQLWPFRYITRAIFKGYDYGLNNLDTMKVYTSSGAGTWGPPMRTFTKSEIVVIELNNE